MSISLTSNFFKNARGLTISDGGGITWAFNKSTNTLSASGSSGGVLSSVGLADASTTPIYTVTNSPLTNNGTLDITLKAQAANSVFAGPTTGAAAQPTFRAMVVADLPTGIPNANLANSSLTVAAGTGLSGGGAVSLGSSVTVSLTTPVAIANGGTGQITAAAAYNALSPMTTLGDIEYESGANTAARLAGNTTATKLFLTQTGTGSVSAAPAWTALVASDIGALGANPTAKVGLAAVNGSASTFMRSDGAPALDQTISPTWTGNHTFTPGSGVAALINAAANAYSVKILGDTNDTSFGLGILNHAGSQVLVLTTVKGWLGSGADTSDAAIASGGIINFYPGGAASAKMVLSAAGGLATAGGIGFNGNAVATQPTGYGTPTGNARTSSFAASTISLANLAAEVAQMVIDLKTCGIFGA